MSRLTEVAKDYRICISCGGRQSVRDLGSGEERPCSLCRKADFDAWIAERQPATRRVARLDDKGRCCGRRPIVYKRPVHYLFCTRCCADLNPNTGSQQENWAWKAESGAFVATAPTADYAGRAALAEKDQPR